MTNNVFIINNKLTNNLGLIGDFSSQTIISKCILAQPRPEIFTLTKVQPVYFATPLLFKLKIDLQKSHHTPAYTVCVYVHLWAQINKYFDFLNLVHLNLDNPDFEPVALPKSALYFAVARVYSELLFSIASAQREQRPERTASREGHSPYATN